MKNNTYLPPSQLSPFPGSSGLIGPPPGPITGPNNFRVKFGSREPHIAGKVQHFNQNVPFIRAPEWWHPFVGDKANSQILLKFGGHSKHQSGVVPHGSTKESVVMPPTWFEPCENGIRIGTRHVRDVKFGMPTSREKLLSLARKEHTKGKAYLEQSPPNKSLAHKHLSRAQQCISTVYLVR